jgi:predicted ATPase
LFTDVEGSTRRWDEDRRTMATDVAAHDETLRAAVDANGGWLFKHTGDGMYAAFSSPRGAIDAAIDAQRSLRLPVRMGIATGEVESRADDYFGPVLNRTARLMAVGHGGQVLVSGSTAGLVNGIDLWDLGEHRLRDLSAVERVFQVRADGLQVEFPPLRTIDAVPGNLPARVTSFVGRDTAMQDVAELVREHPLVTLIGVGGVGKTRLAVHVAAELAPEFDGGVWFAELAPVGDPAALPDAVATMLGIQPQPDRTITESIADALMGRSMLIVLDNCEHVLDAAGDLVEAMLARAPTTRVITTSREGLRVRAEHLWVVPSLDLRDGAASAAVELFVERARAVNAGFSLDDEADAVAVTEICRRLDGIALAIELAAARMVSMSPSEMLARLTDRFRLLRGAGRGLERHQTLQQAVQWSFDLLADDERVVLQHCSVFAGGFDLAAATAVVVETLDEYAVLDRLDSLVRKSLITAERVGDGTRYGLLETIRQFAEDQLATTTRIDTVRDRHARYYADRLLAHFDTWDGPGYRNAIDWLDAEFANLRAGVRWATEQGDFVTATAIAAHTALLSFGLNRFEPIGWTEELLPAGAAADVPQLPRLYSAAATCAFLGRPERALEYAERALALEADSRYEPLPAGWSQLAEANAHLVAGRMDRYVEICTDMAGQSGYAHSMGLSSLTFGLPAMGRADEARAIADEALAVARARGNPFVTAFALYAYGRAFTDTDPVRALSIFRETVAYSREHRVSYVEVATAEDAAGLEAVHGDLGTGLALFDATIDSWHQSGNIADTVGTLATLAILFDRFDRAEPAATIYGATTRGTGTGWVIGLSDLVDHLRAVLGASRFDECVAAGAAMELAAAVQYARAQIQLAQRELDRRGLG